ncbi:unnamed protein product [Rotaria sp. Silwood2]|nr:unnamed protein product [Rotaria sp. Silwood2]CAF4219501.1 unnamed protein product [Rotaria sp. Silwood2]CAF4329381.1 unnamed protein product [Rotaria sp. Silwood2]
MKCIKSTCSPVLTNVFLLCASENVTFTVRVGFASHTTGNLNKALTICIIVHSKPNNPSNINISVVAPLMVAPNVLCLFDDDETFYILSSKRSISRIYSSPNTLTDYQQLPTLKKDELFQNVIIYEHIKIPNDYINIRETEQEIVALDFEKFINTKYSNLITNIDHEE